MEQLHGRSLPHWFMPGTAHFVTYRLAGTLPLSVIAELKAKKQHLLNKKPKDMAADQHRHIQKVLFAEYEKYLDCISDIDWLRDPRIASMLRQNL